MKLMPVLAKWASVSAGFLADKCSLTVNMMENITHKIASALLNFETNRNWAAYNYEQK